MFDAITLDQLRALVAIVEEGSFSAAARRLQRVQSAISKSIANLEDQVGMRLLDRSTKKVARPSAQGRPVLAAAQRVLLEVDVLTRIAAGMVRGVEPLVSLCVDALFPQDVLGELCARFARDLPTVDLRIDTQFMSAVSTRVLAGAATLGIVAAAGISPGLASAPLTTIEMIPVVGAAHPLARHPGRIPLATLAGAVQIVLSERHETGVPDRGVLSPRTWRVTDLATKRVLLRAGVGWGNLPEHLVRDDLRAGALVAIQPEAWSRDANRVSLAVIRRNELALGPAHRWLVDTLAALCAPEAGSRKTRRPRVARVRAHSRGR